MDNIYESDVSTFPPADAFATAAGVGKGSPVERPTVFTSQGLPGSGKTRAVIDSIEEDELVVYSAPTQRLAFQMERDILRDRPEMGCEVVTSDRLSEAAHRHRGKDGERYATVSEAINEALEINNPDTAEAYGLVRHPDMASQGKVVIVCSQSLPNIKPDALRGWVLIIDEIPPVLAGEHGSCGRRSLQRLKDEIDVNPLNGEVTLKPEASGEYLSEMRIAASKEGQRVNALIFEGLAHGTSKVIWRDKSGSGRTSYLLVPGYHDYPSIVRHADETHVLGNGVNHSLFYKLLTKHGIAFEESRFQPVRRDYKVSPILMPLVQGRAFSKEQQLRFPDGTKPQGVHEIVPGCFGWSMLEKAVDILDGRPALVQCHQWQLPFFEANPCPNIVVVSVDTRGLNSFRDVHHSVHAIHGNENPRAKELNELTFKMMGLDEEEGAKATRYERAEEMVIQAAGRTSIRNFDEEQTERNVFMPQTLEMAEEMEKVFGVKAEYDYSIMLAPPKPLTKARKEREEQIEEAVELRDEGLSAREIADAMSKSKSTVSRWLKSVYIDAGK